MVGGVWMALGSLISLVFGRKRLAASMPRLAETPDHPNRIRGRDGRAFTLPSCLCSSRTPKPTVGGVIRIDSTGFSGKAAPSPFRPHLGGQSYSRRFWNELETPGPRVPPTKDGATFAEVAKLGRKLIWLHTYAGRFRGDGRGEDVPQGKATTVKGVSSELARYPTEYGFDATEQEISVGDGRFGPVASEVWEFEISGLKVVQSWLGYRMKKRAGKKSSPLDDIRPERWTARMSDEFLELL